MWTRLAFLVLGILVAATHGVAQERSPAPINSQQARASGALQPPAPPAHPFSVGPLRLRLTPPQPLRPFQLDGQGQPRHGVRRPLFVGFLSHRSCTLVSTHAPAVHHRALPTGPGQACPQLGVTVENLAPQLAESFGVEQGVLVTEVLRGTTADRAGVVAGDVLLNVGDLPVGSVEELQHILCFHLLQRWVTLTVVRRGAPRVLGPVVLNRLTL